MFLEQDIQRVANETTSAIDFLPSEEEQVAELMKLIQAEEDAIKAETQVMENQKRNARRKMTEYAKLSIDNMLIEKSGLKNKDSVI
jgi:hypothetical protein